MQQRLLVPIIQFFSPRYCGAPLFARGTLVVRDERNRLKQSKKKITGQKRNTKSISLHSQRCRPLELDVVSGAAQFYGNSSGRGSSFVLLLFSIFVIYFLPRRPRSFGWLR